MVEFLALAASITMHTYVYPENVVVTSYCPDGTIKTACFVLFHPQSGRYYTWRFANAKSAYEKLDDIKEEINAANNGGTSVEFHDWLEDMLNTEFVPTLQQTQSQEL